MREADRDRDHLIFVGSAFAFALLGGLLLALALPIDALVRDSIGVGWIAHAQIHGHLQTVGFVGLFIVGMAYHLLPGFAGVPRLRYPRLVRPTFWLLAGGVLARAVGQPTADHDVFAVLMVAGAWSEALGAAAFGANVFALARYASREEPFAPFFLAGAGWFLLQALLGALWVTQLAQSGQTILPTDRNDLLVFLQLFGFHLMFILGVAVRSFPVLFAASPVALRRVWWRWGCTQAGIGVLTLGFLVEVTGLGGGWVAINAGAVLAGTGIVAASGLTGWWRTPSRLRPGSRPFAYTLQPAMAWLAVVGLLLVAAALHAALGASAIGASEWDALRHIVAIGVVSMTIAGMAHLIVPELASDRIAGPRGEWRAITVTVVLSVAVIARVVPRSLPGQLSPALVYGAMAVAASITLVLFALLGFYFWRGARHYRGMAAAASTRLTRPGPPREDW